MSRESSVEPKKYGQRKIATEKANKCRRVKKEKRAITTIVQHKENYETVRWSIEKANSSKDRQTAAMTKVKLSRKEIENERYPISLRLLSNFDNKVCVTTALRAFMQGVSIKWNLLFLLFAFSALGQISATESCGISEPVPVIYLGSSDLLHNSATTTTTLIIIALPFHADITSQLWVALRHADRQSPKQTACRNIWRDRKKANLISYEHSCSRSNIYDW